MDLYNCILRKNLSNVINFFDFGRAPGRFVPHRIPNSD